MLPSTHQSISSLPLFTHFSVASVISIPSPRYLELLTPELPSMMSMSACFHYPCCSIEGVGCQVMLYLLLMEERYGTVIERGLLQYLNPGPPEVRLA
jgi:hypothetical protein